MEAFFFGIIERSHIVVLAMLHEGFVTIIIVLFYECFAFFDTNGVPCLRAIALRNLTRDSDDIGHRF